MHPNSLTLWIWIQLCVGDMLKRLAFLVTKSLGILIKLLLYTEQILELMLRTFKIILRHFLFHFFFFFFVYSFWVVFFFGGGGGGGLVFFFFFFFILGCFFLSFWGFFGGFFLFCFFVLVFFSNKNHFVTSYILKVYVYGY